MIRHARFAFLGLLLLSSAGAQAETLEGLTEAQLLESAISAERAGNFPQAITAYRKVLVQSPQREKAAAGLVRVYRQLKQPNEAKTIAVNFLESVSPFAIQVRAELAEVYRANHQYEDAIKEAVRIEVLRPRFTKAREIHGAALFELRKYDEAARILTKAVEVSPKSTELRKMRGISFAVLNKFGQAYTDLTLAYEERKDDPDLLWYLGNVNLKLGKPNEAEGVFQAYAKLTGDSPEAIEKLGDVEAARSNSQAAINYYNKAFAKSPKRADLGMKIANYYGLVKQPEKMETALREVLTHNPDFEPAIEGLANLYARHQHFDQVGAVLRAYANAHPEKSWAATKLANTLIEIDQFDEAQSVLKRAIEANPHDTGLKVTRAHMFDKQGKTKDAIDLLTEVEQKAPLDATVKFDLGVLYTRVGRFEDALRKYREIPDKDALAYKARINTALLFEKQNRSEEALRVLQGTTFPTELQATVQAKILDLRKVVTATTAADAGRRPASAAVIPAEPSGLGDSEDGFN